MANGANIKIEPCDKDIFKNGLGVCALDARPEAAEEWVQAVAKKSGQKVDWHYSGGRANVLYLGDYDKVREAVEELENKLNGRILSIFPRESRGLYRMGDLVPKGTIGVDTGAQDGFRAPK